MWVSQEHERYLCEEVFKKPTIVYNYPCAIKAFYMRRNDPGTDGAPGPTCAAMDVLVPGVGELIGGSVREERHDVLVDAIKETGMDLAYRAVQVASSTPQSSAAMCMSIRDPEALSSPGRR